MNTTARVHFILAHVLLAGVALQYLLAGLGIFGAASFEIHEHVGDALILVALLALVASLLIGRARGWTIVLFVAFLIQRFLP